jgi:anthranilate phosphoribosyltransferase
MQVVYKDTKEATNKRFAAVDAKLRSQRNKALWSAEVQRKVERMKDVLEGVYAGRAYEDWHVTTAGVKVSTTAVSDKQGLEYAETLWAKDGVVKQFTNTGVVYKVA